MVGHMAIVAPLPNNGNGPCDIGNAWPMTMCDIRAMVSLKLKAKDSDQLESLYHPRQTHTWTVFDSFTVLCALRVHITTGRDQIAEDTKREVVFVRQMGM